MATYNREQLRRRVLSRLGVLDPVQGPSPEDAATVDESIQTMLEDRYAEGEIPFDVETDQIPGPYYEAISKLIAFDLAEDFGVIGERLVKLDAGDKAGRRRLKELAAAPYVGGTVKTEYY